MVFCALPPRLAAARPDNSGAAREFLRSQTLQYPLTAPPRLSGLHKKTADSKSAALIVFDSIICC
jgi:hypothetical protein